METPAFRLLIILWDSFKAVQGFFLALFGVVVSFVAWTVLPNEKWSIDVKYVLFTVVFVVFVLLVLTNFFITLAKIIICKEFEIERLKGLSLPAVVDSYFNESSNELYLVLDKSEIFSYGSSVAIYGKFGKYEVLIGFGVVHNIQGNGLVQIKVIDIEPQQNSVFQNIRNKTPGTLPEIIVKNHTQPIVVSGG